MPICIDLVVGQLMRGDGELLQCDVKVEELLGRLRGVLPSAPWLGGVLQPAAWGPGASLRGALFLNSQTHDEGAVGCMMQGPLRFDQLCWQVSNLHLPVHSNLTRQIISCQACMPSTGCGSVCQIFTHLVILVLPRLP